jgi:nitrogen fixation protein FixH
MTQEPLSKRRFNWGTGVFIVYTTFALATIAFAVFSFSTKVDLVADDYYTQELNYDQKYRRIEQAAKLGIEPQCTYDAASGTLHFIFPRPLSGGTIQLYRPSKTGADKFLNLMPTSSTELTLDCGTLEKGLWKIRLNWDSGSEQYFHEIAKEI